MKQLTWEIRHGDALDELRKMPDESVQCVVTSPPYWGLRDYGVDGQLGLERSPAEYLEKMVTVFAEVRRVLRSDGTLWLNMGDAYNAGTSKSRVASTLEGSHGYLADPHIKRRVHAYGLKPKDLIGMPWRLAFALQEDGWWLRQDNIWHKTNPMPESVTDRTTKAHEYVFLLAKSRRYYYDAMAIAEPSSPDTHARAARGRSDHHRYADGGPGNQTIAKGAPSIDRVPGVNPKAKVPTGWDISDGGHRERTGRYPKSKQNASFAAVVVDPVAFRNKRSVWTLSTEPFKGPHYATFPTKLVIPCILAGCPLGGLVLDPFSGAGTTVLVALRLGRRGVGIELNPKDVSLSRQRIVADAPLLNGQTGCRP